MEEQMGNQAGAHGNTLEDFRFDANRKGFDQLFKDTTDLWKVNLADLVLVTLVFVLVAWIPVVNAGFFAGYFRALRKVVRRERPAIADIFSAWDCFGSALVYGIGVFVAEIILGMLPVLGWVAGLALLFFATPGFFAIADRNVSPITAAKWNVAAFKGDLGGWVAVLLVGGLIANAGFLVLVLGGLFTLPWGGLLMVMQYVSQGDLDVAEEE
ncbi:MAG: hypothetical protein R2940_08305 [Syntrophotaleaceae bacterium]